MLEPNLGQEPRDRCTPKLVELGKIAHTGIPEWMGWLPSTNFKWVIVELQCVRWPLARCYFFDGLLPRNAN